MNTANELVNKRILKVLFVTLFLDLIGFSIIFPIFPSLIEYYLQNNPENGILMLIISAANWGSREIGNYAMVVLFGGIVGAIFSFMQFIFAPILGLLSDKYGRRPILLFTVFGLGFSYLLWGFSGSFTFFFISRIVGGIMAGNISAVTAIVADVTDKENRSKGMAIVGIAFALGFIVGPALGGILSQVNLVKIYPFLSSYGINPFSFCAFFAFFLSMINFVNVYLHVKETNVNINKKVRAFNLFSFAKVLPFKGVNVTNWLYFFYLTFFAGMEFTLTFLAAERLGYGPMQNAYLFVFCGVIIVLVQGGFVRRKAHQMGEKKMAIYGLALLIPGYLILAKAQTSLGFYIALAFLSAASAIIVTCFSSIVSLLSPEQNQGEAIGIYRSLGALARVVGPLLASLLYFTFGSASPSLLAAIISLFILPIFIKWVPKIESLQKGI